ncbi:MAG: antibiotic biosynthesis monooxygenase [Patulibacter sp.]|nr:antibiotic biosynthesis monooxygenase [Patulibacter sp.]
MSSPVTFVNVIDVDPSQQQTLIDILEEGTRNVISRRSGFVSSTVLAAVDRRRVVNIARWESIDAVKATQNDPAAAEYAQRAAAIAKPSPGIFTVEADFSA